jgi:branched-chain amino acid transport system ATP-binding protein
MLQLDSVDAYYEKSHVLHDLSLRVERDQVVALLGRNGAGKTTTIKSIMGVTPPTVEGTIRFEDEDVTALSPDDVFRRGISWVPEKRRLFPNLSVEENLRLAARQVDARDRSSVYNLFPRIEDRLEQRAGTLSGGEQQMLAIGRAMLSDPSLLLVDEPFEGLMPTLVTDMVDALRTLRDEESLSILLSGQNLEEILTLSDYMYVLDSGAVKLEDDPVALLDDPEKQAAFLGVK